MDFYVNTLRTLVKEGKIDPSASTLVVAGGPKDRDALISAGFSNVTISNLDVRMRGDEFTPYGWAFVDAENIPFESDSFENVIEHMGLHHCGSPHRALLEMYRVAKSSVVVFENRESWTMRQAVRFGAVPSFELDAVRGNDYKFGGFRNTSTPNFVYRWTEREVEKTILSADPSYLSKIDFFYNLRFPEARIQALQGIKKLIFKAMRMPFAIYATLLPKQANEFGFFISKRDRKLQRWIDVETGGLSPEFIGQG